ncbi:MAG: ABC transporter substrate-binding protein [Chitinispirillia bacterium]|nr:ABC transporter substrate-binding protein [Chitinispirillia bacterium]MCL2241144.1 ABC transporter substrate-binding protein [Chitinispirillia bacterium]
MRDALTVTDVFRWRRPGKVVTAVCVFLMLPLALCLSCDSASKQQARQAKQQQYILIGALFPLTGGHCDEGIRAFNGLQQARSDINDAGGVLGKKLDIIILDDKGDEEYVVRQYQALKERGVAAVIGSSFSDVTMALARAAEGDGIPIISPTATNPAVTEGRRNVFRVTYLDDVQAAVVAGFALRTLSAKTALVIRGDSRFDALADVFSAAFNEGGGRVAGAERYTGPAQFDDILKKYKSRRPDVIFCAADYVDAAQLAEAVHSAGFEGTRLLGTDAWDGILSFAHNIDAMERVYYAAPFAFDEPDPKITRFSQAYFDNFSYTPISTAALTYSAVQILVAAMEKHGTEAGGVKPGSASLVDVIRGSEFDIITGKIRFDENNNPISPDSYVHIMQIKGGYYASVEKIRLNGRVDK